MLDLNNSFLLFQDAENNLMYKAPIRALEGMFALANGETDDVANAIQSIDDLSQLILDLSILISADYYSREEVQKRFEMLSATNAISADPAILKENQIQKYIASHDLVKYEDAEAEMMSLETAIDTYFSKIDNESESYY